MIQKKVKTISTKEFDKKFDDGEDITEYLDLETAKFVIHLPLPLTLNKKLKKQAEKQNISVESLIINWLTEKAKA